MFSTPVTSRRAPGGPVRSTAGFTLIELLVALVISGIVAAAVFEFLLGQTRFARLQTAREEVQQNARAALELISGEIRGVPPNAITLAESNAIRFNLPRAWGILCNNLTTASTVAWVRFPAGLFAPDYPTGSIPPGTWGLAIPLPGTSPTSWQFVTPLSNTSSANPCNASLQPPLAADQVFERGFAASGFVPEGGTMVVAGSRVFVYQSVEYDVGTSNVPGYWIRRNTQPLAGPLPTSNDLNFVFLNQQGSPFSGSFTTAAIGGVRIEVTTRSQARLNTHHEQSTASTNISLRNRD